MTILPSPQQLRYLVALAESRHFGRAALACSVTQSTLSAGILTLERQLDAQILDRAAGRHVVFTPLGLDLIERARAALAALEAVTETANTARAPMSGPLRLGIIPTIGPFLLPKLMPVLRTAFPNLRPVSYTHLQRRSVAQRCGSVVHMLTGNAFENFARRPVFQ